MPAIDHSVDGIAAGITLQRLERIFNDATSLQMLIQNLRTSGGRIQIARMMLRSMGSNRYVMYVADALEQRRNTITLWAMARLSQFNAIERRERVRREANRVRRRQESDEHAYKRWLLADDDEEDEDDDEDDDDDDDDDNDDDEDDDDKEGDDDEYDYDEHDDDDDDYDKDEN
jgi:hypothetical protein